MPHRPLVTTNSDLANYNNVNDFMRTTDATLLRYGNQLATITPSLTDAMTTTSVVKGASSTQQIKSIAHGLTYKPQLIYGIENFTSLPNEWSSGAYLAFSSTTGILNGQVYMSADATNIYLVANTPSGGSLYASALTFNARYRILSV